MSLKLSERECARMATLLCYLIDEGVDYESKPVLLQVVPTLGFSMIVKQIMLAYSGGPELILDTVSM